MKLDARPRDDWPKLAWVARCAAGSPAVQVDHGPCVEVTDHGCSEAVWAGPFDAGNFHETDLVVGTGVRVLDDRVVFVTPGNTLDRIWHFHHDREIVLSNSLSALLAVADLDLIEGHDYRADLDTVILGLGRYARAIPSSGGPVSLTYFHNLTFDGRVLRETSKPVTAPPFGSFGEYRDFLFRTADRFADNSASPGRRHRIEPLVALSRGYDSSLAAVIAKRGGCTRAATVEQARRRPGAVWARSDSGAVAAAALGLHCDRHDREQRDYPYEDAVWACLGNAGDLNLTLFDYPEPLCLLYSGFHGDKVWDRARHDMSDPLARVDTSGSRFSECRLSLGVFTCSPAFWGIQRAQQVQDIGFSEEMAPWTLRSGYDRPIPRRIVEEAGVPRAAFGVRKRASGFPQRMVAPVSRGLRDDFTEFLGSLGRDAMPGWKASLSFVLRVADLLVLRRVGLGRLGCSDWIEVPPQWPFFIWANARRKRLYR